MSLAGTPGRAADPSEAKVKVGDGTFKCITDMDSDFKARQSRLRFATSVIATTGLAAAFGLPRNVYAGNEVDHSRPGIGPRCWGSIVPICRGDDAGLLTRWDRDLTCLFPS